MSEQIKGISIGTWITICSIILSIGANYGIMQTNLKVIEQQIENFKRVSEREIERQEFILRNISEQQRSIDINTNEIQHLRELREIEKNK